MTSTYDTIVGQLDEQAFADSPWMVDTWHPDGVHVWRNDLPINVVVTDWTEGDHYDVNVYTDSQLATDMEPLIVNHVPAESAAALVAGLTLGGVAESTYRGRGGMKVRITEHTTTDDAYCVIENVDNGRTYEFLGSIDEFKERNPGVEIVEEVWS